MPKIRVVRAALAAAFAAVAAFATFVTTDVGTVDAPPGGARSCVCFDVGTAGWDAADAFVARARPGVGPPRMPGDMACRCRTRPVAAASQHVVVATSAVGRTTCVNATAIGALCEDAMRGVVACRFTWSNGFVAAIDERLVAHDVVRALAEAEMRRSAGGCFDAEEWSVRVARDDTFVSVV